MPLRGPSGDFSNATIGDYSDDDDRNHPYVFLDGLWLKQSWGGEVRNVSCWLEVGHATLHGYESLGGNKRGSMSLVLLRPEDIQYGPGAGRSQGRAQRIATFGYPTVDELPQD